jgi:hypothetical protein
VDNAPDSTSNYKTGMDETAESCHPRYQNLPTKRANGAPKQSRSPQFGLATIFLLLLPLMRCQAGEGSTPHQKGSENGPAEETHSNPDQPQLQCPRRVSNSDSHVKQIQHQLRGVKCECTISSHCCSRQKEWFGTFRI